MPKTPLLILIALFVAAPAGAFNVDGVRSGMTTEELVNHGARLGLEVKSGDGLNYLMGKLSQYQIEGSFVVCNGRVVSYSKSVDFDADYANLAMDMIRRYGQPRVAATRMPLVQSTATIPQVAMTWLENEDRIELSFSPEVRDGKGALKMNRGAQLRYSVSNTCMRRE